MRSCFQSFKIKGVYKIKFNSKLARAFYHKKGQVVIDEVRRAVRKLSNVEKKTFLIFFFYLISKRAKAK